MKDYLAAWTQAIKEVWSESSRADKAGLIISLIGTLLIGCIFIAELVD